MGNQQLYLEMKTLLQNAYQGQNQQVADHLLKTLAMMVSKYKKGFVKLQIRKGGGSNPHQRTKLSKGKFLKPINNSLT